MLKWLPYILIGHCTSLSRWFIILDKTNFVDNLLIEGITKTEPEDYEAIVKITMKNKLILSSVYVESVQIILCHRLGPKITNPKRPRTIIINF